MVSSLVTKRCYSVKFETYSGKSKCDVFMEAVLVKDKALCSLVPHKVLLMLCICESLALMSICPWYDPTFMLNMKAKKRRKKEWLDLRED